MQAAEAALWELDVNQPRPCPAHRAAEAMLLTSRIGVKRLLLV
jgi:hypothetical protein